MTAIFHSRSHLTTLLAAATLALASGCEPKTELAAPAPVPVLTASAAPAAPDDDAADRAIGKRWATAFYEGDTQALWDRCDDGMRRVFGSKEQVDAFRESFRASSGAESSVLSERIERREGVTVYVREARFEKDRTFRLRIGFGRGGAIVGFALEPVGPPTEAPTTKLDYVTKTPLRLPFTGTWAVAWGGRTIDVNYHAAARDQRFAYDLFIVRGGATHTGDGKRNSDYFAYGQPVLAPGDGVVVSAIDGVADNTPGTMDPAHAAGNHVILDHGNGEYSLLAHLIPGSLRVKVGDRVHSGDLLGRCGNSGNSSEPHLHFHLQDSPRFGDGDGLPAQFLGYLANGQRVKRGEPTRGELVEAPAPGSARGARLGLR